MTPVLKEMPYKVEKSEGMMPFWDGLNEGKLRSTQCSKCEVIHYPPNPILCSNCFGRNMTWINLPLKGVVTSFTHVTAPPQGFDGDYILASVIVDTLEKPILGRFVDEKIEIGDRVKITFEKVGEQALFVFSRIMQ